MQKNPPRCTPTPARRLHHALTLTAISLALPACIAPSSRVDRSLELPRHTQANDPITTGAGLAGTLFRATAISTIKQPFTTLRLGGAILWNRPREIISANIPIDLNQGPQPTAIPGTPEFEILLDQANIPPNESGTVTLLLNGNRFFPALQKHIASATTSIDCQIFIFDNDDVGVRCADWLKQRSNQIPVRVLFDDLGTTFAHATAPLTLGPPGFIPPANIQSHLTENSGVRVRRIINPWLVCDHTKLIVFDRKTALLGGMNLGREYLSEWRDLMLRVEGPVVASLTDQFERAWRKAGPAGDFARIQPGPNTPPPPASPQDFPIRILRTNAATGRHDILHATLLAIRAARKRIWIENPYFAHDDIALAVATAARRGVDVRIIIPSRGDSTIMDVGNLATAHDLILAGAKVYQFPRMTHLKAMICDDWATLGSANLDTLSLRINRELNIAYSHPQAIRDLETQIFRPAFRQSNPLTAKAAQTTLGPLAETLADQL